MAALTPSAQSNGRAAPARSRASVTTRKALRTATEGAVGSSGLQRWKSQDGYQITEEFVRELQGINGAKIYDEMRKNDPIIGGLLRATTDIIRGVKWKVSPEKGKASVLLDQAKDDMSHSWSDVLADITTMCAFGWSWFEVTYKQRNGYQDVDSSQPSSQYDDGRIGWHKIALRAQDSLAGWDLADNGDVQGMNQRAAPDFKLRTIPISKSLLFRTQHERNNPEGLSMLRTSWHPYYMKKNLEEIEGIGIERDFTGLPVIEMPKSATAEDWQTADDILTRIKSDEQAGITFQKGGDVDGREDWTLSLMASAGTKAIDVDKAINRYATEICVAFLAQFMRLGLAGTSGARGSSSLGSTQKEFFFVALSALIDNIEDTFNRFGVPPLMRLNGFKQPYPKLKHGRIAPRDMAAFINALERLAGTGILGKIDNTLVNFVRDEIELPSPEEPLDEPISTDPLESARMQQETAVKTAKTQAAAQAKAQAAKPATKPRPNAAPDPRAADPSNPSNGTQKA